jgi:hypothetical protein
MRLLMIWMLTLVLVGCSSEVKLKEAPVSVSGKVSHSGQPLGGILMTLQPLDNGHVREFPVKKDGTFGGELVSGEYAYYVARPNGAAHAPSNLSAKYFEADLSRTVTVEPGQQLAIELD